MSNYDFVVLSTEYKLKPLIYLKFNHAMDKFNEAERPGAISTIMIRSYDSKTGQRIKSTIIFSSEQIQLCRWKIRPHRYINRYITR